MHIDFHDQTRSVSADIIDLLQRLLTFTALQEDIPREAEVSINFVHNRQIRELNRNYRQQDAITDVISFALQEQMEGETAIVGEDLPLALGDVVISVEQAQLQSVDYGHSYERELGFLTVHGFLHLIGYDHVDESDERKMFQKQEEILEAFGLER